MRRLPIIERTYALARSGSCTTVADIRRRLKSEGYTLVEDFVAGKRLLDELKQLCRMSVLAKPAG